MDVLRFIARFGVVPRSAAATWAGTARSVTIARESRLRKQDLIRVFRGYGDVGALSVCTKVGLAASGRKELRPARVSAAAIHHEAKVAELAAVLERDGTPVLSEREMLANERAAGRHLYSASLDGGRVHRADLMGVGSDGGPGEAIEVELTQKGAARLDELLRAWRRAAAEKKITRVVYRCSPRTLEHVARAVERTKTDAVVSVREL